MSTQIYHKLNTGVEIPAVGFGTWQDVDDQEDAVLEALKAGVSDCPHPKRLAKLLRLSVGSSGYDSLCFQVKPVRASAVPLDFVKSTANRI